MAPAPERVRKQRTKKPAGEGPKLVSNYPSPEQKPSRVDLNVVPVSAENGVDAAAVEEITPALTEDERAAALELHQENLKNLRQRPRHVTGGILSREYLDRNVSETNPRTKWRRGALHLQRHAQNAEIKQRLEEAKAPSAVQRTLRSVANAFRSLGLSALAIFPTVNMSIGKEMLAPGPAPRARTLEETQRLDRSWTIQEESTIVFGAPDSPFADLFDENHNTIQLPNLFFGQEGTNLFGSLEVGREDTVQVSGPELLERVWNVRCAAASSPTLALLRDERLRRYTQSVEAGTLQRSSLALEMARLSGYERGTTYTNAIWGRIRWDDLAKDRGMSSHNLELARDITGFLSPAHIEAIILAEIAPQMELPNNAASESQQVRQAQVNVRLYDFMLRRYGRELINDFPALGDRHPIVSIGGIQSTHWVLGPGSSTGIINGYLDPEAYELLALLDRDGGIKSTLAEDPGDVDSLEEQRVIGYMNAIYNVIFAIESSASAREGFERIREGIVGGSPEMRLQAQELLAEFLFAHNDPAEAVEALSAWTAAGRELTLEEQLARPLARYADERNHVEYATSMRYDYRALDAVFSRVVANRELRGNAIAQRGGTDPTITFPGDSDRWNQIRRGIRNSVG